MNPVTELEPAHIAELLGAFRELQAQFDMVRERLRRAEEHRHTVARRIYDRVRSDYDHELDAIRARLTPLRDELERVHEALEVQCRDAGAATQAVEEELAEAEFRHRLGEFETVAFDEMRGALDTRASDARARQAAIQSTLDAITSARANGPAAATLAPEPLEETFSLAVADIAAEPTPFADEDDFSSLIVDEPPSLERSDETDPVTEHAAPAAPVESVTEVDEDPAPNQGEFSAQGVEDVSLDAEEPEVHGLADEPHVEPAVEVASPAQPEVAPAPGPAPVAAVVPASAPAPRTDNFENPQAWVSDMGADGNRPERRRARLSMPAPAPSRGNAMKDELESALEPLAASIATATAAAAAAPARATAPSPATPASLPSLVFVSGAHAGHAIALLPTTLTIGREHDNNVEIKDPDVARYHARILRERDAFVVEDLNSSTGTFVNGERKNRAVLSHGDVIRVGQTELALDFEWTTDSR
jgi:hypothetical protein